MRFSATAIRRLARAACAVAATGFLTAVAPSVAGAQVDLVLNVSDAGFDPIPRGGVIKYAVRIDNNGISLAHAVTFTFTVPGNASYNGFKGTSFTCGAAVAGIVSCTVPNVAAGANMKDTMFVNATTQGIVSVNGVAGTSDVDVAPGNNSVGESTTVVAGANVGISVAGPSSAASGTPISYAISVTNGGPDPATSLTVQVSLPTGFAQSGSLPSGCSIAGATVTCSVAGPINSGSTLNLGNIGGQVTAGSGSTLTGAANVQVSAGAPAGTAQDSDNSNNTAAFSTTVTAGSDVKVVLSRSPSGASFGTGQVFTFTVTPTYTGDTPNTLTITDVIPGNYTIGAVGASQNGWSCGVAGQTVTCTKPTGSGVGTNVALGVVTIPVTAAVAGNGIVNTVTISSASPADPDLSNNSSNDGGVNITGSGSDLAASKTGPTPQTAVVGQTVVFHMSGQNLGPSPMQGTLIATDHVPAGLSYVGFSSANANSACSPAASPGSPIAGPVDVTCTRTSFNATPFTSGGTLAAIDLSFVVTASGSLNNCMTLSTSGAAATSVDGNPANNSSCYAITTATGPNSADLSVIKTTTPFPATVGAGEVLTYVLNVVNAGPVASTNVTLTDDFTNLINNNVGATAAGYISETVTIGSGISCSNAANGTGVRRLTCTIPSVAVCTLNVNCPQITVLVRPGGDGGVRANSATATSSTTPDPNINNNTGSVNATVDPRADVYITASATPSSVASGQNLVYVLTAGNNGPSQGSNVTVTDSLPLNMLFVSAVPSAGSCGVTPGANVTTTAGNRAVQCNLGSIANGAQGTVTVTVRPGTSLRNTTVVDTAKVTTSTQEPVGAPANNNAATASATVTPPSLDLLINKTDSVDPLTVGNNTVYTVTVSNAGPSDAETLVLTDNLPGAGLSFQSATTSAGSCGTQPAVDAIGGALSCTLAHLASGATWTTTVTMKGVTKGIYTNNASIASSETGLGFENPANNAASQQTTVRSRTDMTVESKVATPGTIGLRKPFTYTIRVRNLVAAGLAEADTVHVLDNLPAGIELTGTPTVAINTGTTTLNTCTGAAGSTSFDCSLGTVSNGAILDVTVPVRATAIPAGNVAINTATVTTASGDVNPANNANTGNVTINGSTLSGLVYRDFNNNGTADGTDTGISGITITLAGTAFDASPVNATTTTIADGTFSFTALPQGTYKVTRGAVSETFLTVGTQSVGDRGGNAATVPDISAIALGDRDAGTGYRFAFVPQARIGLAKRVTTGPTLGGADNSFTTTLRVFAKNYSLETLNTVNITDVLAGAAPALGGFVAGGAGATLTNGTYTVNSAPAFTAACAGGAANGAYDGSGTTTLATIASLAPGASCEVEFIIRFRPTVPLPGGGYSNQANVTSVGALSGQTPSDPSQNGADPDPDADNNPGNNNVPTPLPVSVVADVTTTLAFPASANAGNTVNGTVVFTNNGPFPAANTAFALTLSPGLAGVTFGNLPGGAVATYNSGTGVVGFTGMPTTLTQGQIASGNGVTGITVSYTQNVAANTTIASNIGTSTSQGANVAPDAATTNVTGAPVADVTTALAFPANVNAGNPVSGTILFKNNGPSTAATVTYQLTLSTGLAGVSFGNLPGGATASYASGTGVVTFAGMPASLAAGQIASGDGTTQITLTYTQPVAPSTSIASHIGTATSQGANVAPDDATATVTGVAIADVTTSLAFPGVVNAGSPVSGTILFSNAGPSPAAGMVYTLVLTPNLAGVTFGNLPAGGTATYTAGTGVVTLGGFPATLANGQIASGNGATGITLTYTQPGSSTSTITSHIGTSTSQGANVNPDDATVSPSGALVADVRAAVAFPATVNAGLAVNGTVTFSNDGPSTAAGVTYTVQLTTGLAGVTLGNLPGGAAASYNSVTGVVTFTGMPVTLTAGQVASGNGATGITVQYVQPGTATSSVVATITTTTNQGANAAPDTANATINGAPVADVTTALVFPASANASATVNGTILFQNNGPSTAAGVSYQLTLSTGLAGVTFGNLGGAVATYNAATGVVTFTGLPVSLTNGQIASGNGASPITLSYAQPAVASSTIASVIGTTTNQGANAAPDNANAAVAGVPIADVTTSLTFPASVNAGNSVAGTILFRNTGPSPAATMVYTLQLTTGLAGVTLGNLPAGGTASYNAGTGVVTLAGFPATLANQQVASGDGTTGITLSYVQHASGTSTITSHTGTSTSQGANVNPDDATVSPSGALIADVRAAVSFPATVNAGLTVNGTVTFSNDGPSTAAGVTYTVQLTSGLAGVTFGNLPGGATTSYNSVSGVVTFAGMPLTLTVGQIASGNGATGITVQYVQPGSATSTVVATITTTTNQGANAAPDTANATVNGTQIADVTTVLSFPASANAGATVNGTILFQNNGPSTAAAVTYQLTLSTGLAGVTFGNLGGATASYNAGTGVVTFAGLPASLSNGQIASGNVSTPVTVSYTQPATPSSTIASVIGTTTNQGANVAPDNANAAVVGVPIADVTTSLAFPASVNAGNSVAGVILFRNTGPSPAATMVYTLQLATGLAGVTFGNLPAGGTATYVPATGVVTLAGFPATLTTGQIASGDGTTGITLTYTQPGSGTSTVTSHIGTSTSQGANVNLDDATTTIGGVPVADVRTVVAFPPSVNAGLLVNGTVTFSNQGPSSAAAVTYTIQLNAGLAGLTFGNLPPGATASYAAGTGLVTFAGMPGTLTSGQIASGNGSSGITVQYVQPGLATSTVTGTITTTTSQGANLAPDTDSATIAGAPIADVTTVLAFPASVNAGGLVNGTVLFKNNGPSTAGAVTYQVTLSTGLSGVTFGNLPAGASAAYNAGTGVVTLAGMPASLASGQVASGSGSTPIQVSYAQGSTPPTTVASVIGTSTNQGANVAPDNANAAVGGNSIADVTTSLTFPVVVNAGSPVAGTILFRNTGPSTATGMVYTVALTPNLPGVTFGNLPAGGTATYVPATGVVTITGFPATLTSGQTASGDGTTGITLIYTQPGSGTSTITSHIGTSSDQGANVNPDDATVMPAGGLVADVRTVVAFPASVNAGLVVNGTVTFSNQGPSPAAAVGYAIQMNAGLAGVVFGNLPVGATASYAPATGLVTFTGMPSALAAGQIASGNGASGITLQYVQPGTATSTVVGTITTTTSQGANLAPDTDTATITGVPIADVTTALAFPASVNAGSPVSGTVLFKNNGPSTAAAVTYQLTLSTGLSGVTFGNLPAGASATYNAGTGVVTLTAMPATLSSGQVASGNGAAPIQVTYTQGAMPPTTIASVIGTSTNQGANAAPDNANAAVAGNPIADVTTSLTFPVVVNAGSPVSGTILYRNTGPSTATGMIYTLTLTPGLSGVSFGNLPAGGTATYVPATGVVTITGFPATLAAGQLASGDGATGITLTYTQPGTGASTITSHVGTSSDQGANVNLDDATLTPGGGLVADVRTVLAFPATVNAGQLVNGTVTFSNQGPSPAAGVGYTIQMNVGLAGVVFGNLPAGASASYAPATGLVTFTGMPSALAAGQTASGNGTTGITLQYVQPGPATSTVVGTITTTTSQGANLAPDTDTATVTGTPIADVTTTMSFPAFVPSGSPVSGTVVFTNTGPSSGAGMTYSITLNAGLAGVSFANLPAGATAAYNSGTGLVTFAGMPATLANGVIASGNGATGIAVTYTQPVAGSSAIASHIGTSTNQGANAAPDDANATVLSEADVTTALAFPPRVDAGNLVSGTVLFRNNGPSTANGVTYSLQINPALAAVTFANLPAGGAASYNAATGLVTFTGFPISLASGQIASGNGVSGIVLSYTQPATPLSTIASTIATTTNQGANAAPDNASASVGGGTNIDLAVTKTASLAQVAPAGTIGYTIRVVNNGPGNVAAGSTLVDTPSGLTIQTVACSGASGNNCIASPAVAALTGAGVSLPALAVGTFYELTVTALVTQASGSIVNTAKVTTPPGTVDPTPANNTSTVTTPIVLGPNLSITKSAIGTSFAPGGAASYTIQVQNGGAGATTAPVTIVDALPSTLTFVSATGAGWTCTASGQTVTCTMGAVLAAGASASAITMNVTIAAGASGTIVNTATVSTPGDLPGGNKTGTATIQVGGPNLGVIKTIATDTLRANTTTSYTITVTNSGTQPTTGVVTLTDNLPAGITPTTAAGGGFSCAITGQSVTCTRPASPPLAPGASVSVTVTVNVGSTVTSGPVVNTACVSTPGDIVPANDCGSVSTPVGEKGKNPFTIKKDTVGGYIIGQPGLFRFTLKTSATARTSGPAYIIDSLPAGMTYKGFTGTGWSCSPGASTQIVTCKNPNPALNPGDSAAVLTLITELSAAAKGAFGNCAVVVTDDAPLAAPDKKSCVFANAHYDYRLALTLTTPRYVLQVGDSPDFTVHVKNVGGSPLPDVLLTNILPNGFTYVPGTSRRGGDPSRSFLVAGASKSVAAATRDATAKIPDPAGGEGPSISWPLGGMNPGDDVIIVYKAKIHVGASFNTDNITRSHAVSEAGALSVESNADQVPIRLERGLFDDHGVIAGKVYMHCNCAGDTTQTFVDLGIPGVRIFMEDGSSAITDVEGKYDFTAVRSGLHVVHVDRTTLPAGAALLVLDNRNADDAYSRFVDLKSGELARADFVEGSRSEGVFDAVLARRRKGEVNQAGDSVHVTPMQLSNAPVMRPVVEGIPGTTGSYVPLVPPTLLGDGNSNLPQTPQSANARLHGLPLTPRQGTVSIDVPGSVPADGRTVTPVHVVVRDSAGRQLAGTTLVTLETTAGGWVVPDADRVNLGTQVTLVDGEGTFNLMAAREPAVARIRAQTSLASTTVDVNFITAPRPLIATGLFQGRLDIRSVSRGGLDLSQVGDGFETRLNDLSISRDSGRTQAGARAALFVKGEVEHLGQLTLRYDSQNDRLLGEFRDIQPDNYFPIYGDAAIREFDAQSSQRLYARIDRGTSFIRYGDFTTTRSDDRRILLAWNRSLTGLLDHTEGKYGVFNGYVSQSHALLTVDELRGRGLSGPYGLTKPNAIQNSERVEIVTRDRNQPAVILKTQLQTRFEDYTVDPATATLTFKSPVPSLDENLNPVSIRVSYELDQGGTSFLTYGGDAVARIGMVELGGFVARDENPLGKQLLAGASITARLAEGTLVMGEFARTDNDQSAGTGDAWRLELRHQSSRLEARVYGIQSDSTYLNQSSTFASGRKEFGGRFAATVSANSRVLGEVLHTEDIRTTGNRDGASLAFEQRLSRTLIGEIGYRYADESAQPATFQTAGATPISLNSVRARLTARLPDSKKSSVFGEVEKSLDDAAHRISLGGEYMLFDHTRMYGRQEWISSFAGPYALNDGQYQQNTVFGIDANVLKSSQVFSEYRLRDAIAGRDAEASYGLRNRWAISQGVLASTSFERVSTIVGDGRGRAFAVTGGLELTQSPLWKASTRLEWRNTSAGDELLASGAYARKLSRDWTTIARTLWQRMSTDELRARSQVGLAWRQTDGNTTNALFRLENRVDNTVTGTGEMDRARANIAALLVNTQPTQHFTLSGRYAGKIASDNRDGTSLNTTAQLVMGRAIFDVTHKLDAGIIGSILGDGGFSSRQYGVGGELGYIVMRNLRVAGGYNVFGFSDKDFDALGYTQKGPYLEFGFKFDESLLGVGSKPQDGRKP